MSIYQQALKERARIANEITEQILNELLTKEVKDENKPILKNSRIRSKYIMIQTSRILPVSKLPL